MTHRRLVCAVLALFMASCQYGTAYVDLYSIDGGISAVDAAVGQPDSAVGQPDSAVAQSDSAVVQPDSAVAQPDSAVVQQDSAVAQQDSAVTQQDGGSGGTWTAPDFTMEDLNPASPTYGMDLTASDNLGRVVVIYFSSYS